MDINLTNNIINNICLEHNLHPILVDIGSTGDSPVIWSAIESFSTYIGFDPDTRDIQIITDKRFKKKYIINKAVTSSDKNNSTLFYYTKSTHCSSTLFPNFKSLSNYYSLFNIFQVENVDIIKTTTLNQLVSDLNLSSLDWIKLDTQGTDLRIIKSLNSMIFNKVLVVDVEPGLIDAYVGEDLFSDVHGYLVGNGFWLSTIGLNGANRIKQSTIEEMNKRISNFHKSIQKIKGSPGWCNARYLRTLEWLNEHSALNKDYILLWIFSIIDNQIGFALDIAFEYEKLFGKSNISEMLVNYSLLIFNNLPE